MFLGPHHLIAQTCAREQVQHLIARHSSQKIAHPRSVRKLGPHNVRREEVRPLIASGGEGRPSVSSPGDLVGAAWPGLRIVVRRPDDWQPRARKFTKDLPCDAAALSAAIHAVHVVRRPTFLILVVEPEHQRRGHARKYEEPVRGRRPDCVDGHWVVVAVRQHTLRPHRIWPKLGHEIELHVVLTLVRHQAIQALLVTEHLTEIVVPGRVAVIHKRTVTVDTRLV
eukprot:scaffold5177_cov130-Isochrysis_galbana.AAC.3